MNKRDRAILIYKQLNKTLDDLIEENTKEYLKDLKEEDWYDVALNSIPDFAKGLLEILVDYRKKYVEVVEEYGLIEDGLIEKIKKYVKIIINKEDEEEYNINTVLNRNLDELEEELEEELIEYYQNNMEDVIEKVIAGISDKTSIGYSFDLIDEATKYYLTEKSIKWGRQVSETTNKRIKELLVGGYEDGIGMYELAQRIEDAGIFSYGRAETIARTEIITANRYTEFLMYQMNDEIYGKEWSSTGDSRTRLDHAIADGQIRKINEPFEVGGEEMLYPGDTSLGASAGNTINCRCAVFYLTKEEYYERK